MCWQLWREKNDFASGVVEMKGRFLLGVVAALSFATSAVAGISGGALSKANTLQLILLGPVEAVSERDGNAMVLGQRLSLEALGPVEVGQTVAVFGDVKADGTLFVSQVRNLGQYVPGATTVLLTGVVQKLNSSIGRTTVNGVSVDINSVVSLDETGAIGAGTLVQVAGIQPNASGLLLAQGISGGAKTSGISGGALANGISGGALTSGISGGAL